MFSLKRYVNLDDLRHNIYNKNKIEKLKLSAWNRNVQNKTYHKRMRSGQPGKEEIYL